MDRAWWGTRQEATGVSSGYDQVGCIEGLVSGGLSAERGFWCGSMESQSVLKNDETLNDQNKPTNKGHLKP